jgi:hypothetical protein
MLLILEVLHYVRDPARTGEGDTENANPFSRSLPSLKRFPARPERGRKKSR